MDLSHGFIKILDGKWTRLWNICYMFVCEKGNIGYRRTRKIMLIDQESMKSKVLKDILKKQDIMIDLGK